MTVSYTHLDVYKRQLLNIVLDPVFILPWGLGMGAEGAGLATFLSNCVACLYFFVPVSYTHLGAAVTHAPKTVKKFLGFTLLPHSGVSLVFTGIAVSVLSGPAPVSYTHLPQGTCRHFPLMGTLQRPHQHPPSRRTLPQRCGT